MPDNQLQVLQLRPGVNKEGTSYSGEGGWYECDKVRFRSGLPEKLGGWVPFATPTFLGSSKLLVEWLALSGYYLLGVGTNLKFYILTGGTYYDITPIRLKSTGLSSPFQPLYSTLSASIGATDTTIFVSSGTTFDYVAPFVIQIGSELIYVQGAGGTTLSGCIRGFNGTTAAAHSSGAVVSSSWMVCHSPGNGATLDDFVTFSGATAFGPYTAAKLNSQYQIAGVSGDYIIFDIGVQSTSATAGGGTVTATYQIFTGLPYTESLNGWGAGPWVSMPLSAGASTTTAFINSTATTIPVASAISFPSSGYAVIESEVIQYTGTTSTSLTGVTRGISLNATSHMPGVSVNGIVYSSGSHAWNTGYAGGGTAEELRLWSACNFGQDLYFNIRNGGIYVWQAAANLSSGGSVTGPGVALNDSSVANIPVTETVIGNYYQIYSLGTTTQIEWNTLAGTTGVTYSVGSQFNCQGAGTGTGVVFDPSIPTVATCVTVTDERFVVAFGCNDYFTSSPTIQDPMFIAWSDQEAPETWYPTVTNQAGNFRLTYGSRIMGVERTRQEILVWTDTALYSMQFIGSPYTYSFNPISTDVTIVSQNCMATAGGITYWMGQDKFYAYSGRVDTLPCALRQYVFSNINTQQWELVTCGTNEKYNEVWWFYPSANSIANDSYVVYNYLEKVWYYGTIDRSSWLDSHIVGNPLGTTALVPAPLLIAGQTYMINTVGTTDFTQVGALSNAQGTFFIATGAGTGTGNAAPMTSSIVVQHESGADDGAYNPPQPIYAYIESSDFDIGDGGTHFSFVKRLIPDIDFIASTTANPSATMTLKARNYPGQGVAGLSSMQNSASGVSGAEVSTEVYNYTQEVWIRIRGRQMVFRVESDALGVRWQLGTARIQIQSDGRR